MKPLVIYHGHCTDGFGAAFAAWLSLRYEAEYVSMSYGSYQYTFDGYMNVGNDVYRINGRDVYILDFSLKKDEMDDLIFKQTNSVVWLDHHKSSFDMWLGNMPVNERYEFNDWSADGHIKIILDNDQSGAALAWGYFHPGKLLPKLFMHIDDRDRWQFKDVNSRAIHEALQSYQPWGFEQWERDFLHIDMGSYGASFKATASYYAYVKEGETILRAHALDYNKIISVGTMDCNIVSYAPEWVWTGADRVMFKGLMVNCPPQFASDVGNRLAEISGTFGLAWYLNTDGTAHCSIRSNGAYDVSRIAELFGGGGHRNAAGFNVSMPTLLGWRPVDEGELL